ncbi:MAG: methyltransferase domain-containing protein [bacterium]
MFERILRKINNEHQKKIKEIDDFYRLKEHKKLSKFCENKKNIKLHFGCGPRIIKGWVNIDLSFEPFEKYLESYTDVYYPETIRGNIDDFFGVNILKTGLPFSDNSIDVIFHEDFIEHLDQKEQIIFLSETFRVLKRNSIHRINTPNLLYSMRKNSNFNKGKEGVYVEEWDKHIHKNLLTPNYLNEIAKMIGYSNIIFNSRNKSLSKEIPKEYRPGKDRTEEGNIFADLIK